MGKPKNNNPKKDGSYSENTEHSEPSPNVDTVTILNAMNKMKLEIIEDRKLIDQEICAKIDALSENLGKTITQHATRLDSLEFSNTDRDEKIAKLQNDVGSIRKVNQELQEKLLVSVAHSRRLNLDFLGFEDEQQEQPLVKVKNFLTVRLGIPKPTVDAIMIRDGHRIGKWVHDRARPRVIKVGFVRMEDRDLILSLAHKCKGSQFAISVDLPPELQVIRKAKLDMRKEILQVNPDALASLSYRSYKPVLLVKYNNKVQEYKDTMPYNELQGGDVRS